MNRGERLALYVALTALTAFAIDGVLPAMPMIEAALPPAPPFSGAQVITVLVLGMAIGEILAGPLSDAVGRRPAVIAGLVIFAIGTIFSLPRRRHSRLWFSGGFCRVLELPGRKSVRGQ